MPTGQTRAADPAFPPPPTPPVPAPHDTPLTAGGPEGHPAGAAEAGPPPGTQHLTGQAKGHDPAAGISAVQVCCLVAFVLGLPLQRFPVAGAAAEALYAAVMLATTALFFLAARRERSRPLAAIAWSLLAIAHLSTAAGMAVSTRALSGHLLTAAQPATAAGTVTWADLLYLAYYPLVFVAAWLLVRDRTPRWLTGIWWDALTVGLGGTAIGWATLGLLRAVPRHRPPGLPLDLIYPLSDVVLVAVILAIASLTGVRLGAFPWWLAGGLSVVALSDAALLAPEGLGRHSPSLPVELGWLVGYTLIGVSARAPSTRGAQALGARFGRWLRLVLRRGDRRGRPPGWLRVATLPWLFTIASAGVLADALIAPARAPVPRAAALLALASIGAALLRAALPVRSLAHLPPPDQTDQQERTDELTGLANRRALSEALATEGTAPQQDGWSGWSGWTDRIALLLVDIDRFKDINEALGYSAGDEVIAEVGSRLQGALRPNQLLARLGVDEFAVVLPGAGPAPAQRVAETLRLALAEPIEAAGNQVQVRASVGVATCTLPNGSPEDLLRHADIAVHRAKASGGGVATYDPGVDRPSSERLRRIEELRRALAHGELEVYLQPQVHLVQGTVVGVEALARWRHPRDGMLLPDSFLPLAAQTGLMPPVAPLVLQRALTACARWWARGHRLPVSVNLTPDDLRDPALSEWIKQALDASKLPAAALRIEVTEDALLSDPAAAARVLAHWREQGARVALDDYGTGYSSLAHLRTLPLDELKLDRVFVADLRRPTTAIIIRHTIAMAHELELSVVAEGVEDQATARALADARCDVGQGLYFGDAMTVTAFLRRLEGTAR